MKKEHLYIIGGVVLVAGFLYWKHTKSTDIAATKPATTPATSATKSGATVTVSPDAKTGFDGETKSNLVGGGKTTPIRNNAEVGGATCWNAGQRIYSPCPGTVGSAK